MIILYQHLKGINVKEEEELFKLKDNFGTGTNGYKLAMNKNRQEIGGELLHHQQNQALEQPRQLVWVKHKITV